jgi:hypothetical protein
MRNPQTPLSPREETAFERLRDVVGQDDDGCQRDTAVDALVARGFDDDEAVHLIEQLLLKGYLYAVHDDVRLTY